LPRTLPTFPTRRSSDLERYDRTRSALQVALGSIVWAAMQAGARTPAMDSLAAGAMGEIPIQAGPVGAAPAQARPEVEIFALGPRSEEHTSELQSLRHLV